MEKPITNRRKRGVKPLLSKEQVYKMRKVYKKQNKSVSEIAEKFDVSYSVAYNALTGRGTYKGV